MANSQAQRLGRLSDLRQRARIDADRLRAAANADEAATRGAMLAQERTNLTRDMAFPQGIPDEQRLKTGGGIRAGQILRRGGRGMTQVMRATRRLGAQTAYGKFEAEEDLASIDANQAGIALDEARAAQMRSAMAVAAATTGIAQGQRSAGMVAAGQQKMRREVEKKAKAAFKRGVAGVVSTITAAFDIGSWITFMINWIWYFAILGWMNFQLIYGTYFTGGNSKYVSPLDWDPLPINGIVPPIILHIIIIAIDITLIIAAGIMVGIVMLVFTILADIWTNPLQSASDMILGTGELGDFTDIIRDVFGLL